MMRVLLVACCVLASCTDAKTVTDPDATAIEIVTDISASDGVTQLRIIGTSDGFGGADAFAPGMLPDEPRALSGRQTAVVLLPSTLNGTEVSVRVDAMAGDQIVRSGGATVTVLAQRTSEVAVMLGAPAICGDGMLRAPLETCDDTNSNAADGCSDRCTTETGFTCSGAPSTCRPFATTKEIRSYAFGSVNNPGALNQDARATIMGTNVNVIVPAGTDVTALVATFSTTGTSVAINGAAQVSGTTANDFTTPITYRVTAEDGSTKDYMVTVMIAGNTAKELTMFQFLSSNNAIAADVSATITGTTINAILPNGTSLASLKATFMTTGTGVAVGGTTQVSGVTANNFSGPVVYRVTAADLSTKDYTVMVTTAVSSAKDLTSFDFLSVNNPSLPADVVGQINGAAIALTVPAGTPITTLVPTFMSTGTGVSINAVAQVSGTSANDFTASVIYRVTAADASTKDYTVTVTVALASTKDITSYKFLSANNQTLSADVTGTITGTSIAVSVPFGTNLNALKATFATTGVAVTIGTTTQVSGATPNNFASPVMYTVKASDNSTKVYTVTVTVAAGSEKDITAYAFLSTANPSLSADVVAMITGTSITAAVPFGTNVNNLKATFSTTGAQVRVGAQVQTSGITTNNFTNPVTYTVSAGDASTKQYTVTVTVAGNTDKDITAFSFLSANNSMLPADAIGMINGTTITLLVPTGIDKKALIANFTTTGASVKVNNQLQTSGQTPNNWNSGSRSYVVTAANGSTKIYVVNVTEI